MTPETQIMLWGLAACTPLAINTATKQGPDSRGLAAMIVIVWSFGRVMSAFWTPPECMALNPLIDSCAGATAYVAWATKKSPWKLILAFLYLTQVGLAFDFWWGTVIAGVQHASVYRYLAMNNILFLGQLLTVSSPGGLNVSRRVIGWLPSGPGPFHRERT